MQWLQHCRWRPERSASIIFCNCMLHKLKIEQEHDERASWYSRTFIWLCPSGCGCCIWHGWQQRYCYLPFTPLACRGTRMLPTCKTYRFASSHASRRTERSHSWCIWGLLLFKHFNQVENDTKCMKMWLWVQSSGLGARTNGRVVTCRRLGRQTASRTEVQWHVAHCPRRAIRLSHLNITRPISNSCSPAADLIFNDAKMWHALKQP